MLIILLLDSFLTDHRTDLKDDCGSDMPYFCQMEKAVNKILKAKATSILLKIDSKQCDLLFPLSLAKSPS